ncbi:helix-turn-helix transcriptional regulator [Burkholderia cenocepacia]|uniref:helix-turn-helix transcriptional regulator n=1 Tax=Burkholderia cenocepacia TaxID=95486 RepID=UPI001CF349D3|nr:AlpA family phage regulatory protein [Burkholderia cenocepacia]MCA8008637.1 AlpA family phage regulatory protein [Burkholderia cenocepacia]
MQNQQSQEAHQYTQEPPASQRFAVLLRCVEVQQRTGLSRSSMYARMNPSDAAYDSSFPLPVNVSAKGGSVSNRWIAAEVDMWIVSRPRTRVVVGKEHGRGS